jgi:spore maturation protein CgeB
MKFVLGHAFTSGVFGQAWIDAWLARLRSAGIEITGLPIPLDVPGRRLTWRALDARWRRGDRELMRLYERIARHMEDHDVLINYGGLNLHPRFLEQLPLVSVLGFFDDPESSEYSQPVAAAHDVCMVGNIAELDTYRAWGARHVRWWPNGFRQDDFDPTLTEARILDGSRDVDVALLCERVTHYRREKVDAFALAFPQGVYRGPGWPQGFLPEAERIPLLQRTKIGINIHNSTGPINFRTFYLPANGVLQICDNKSPLGQVFELGTEVIGYDSMAEAIEYTRYYLAHEDERRAIAAAGWRRVMRDYNEVEAFRHVVRGVEEFLPRKARRTVDVPAVLVRHSDATRPRRVVHGLVAPLLWPVAQGQRVWRGLMRRAHWLADTVRLRLAARARRSPSPDA